MALTRPGSGERMRIARPAILDARGADITPAGLHWSIARSHGQSWLQLRVDDTALAVPYVIDPAITIVDACSSVNYAPPGGGANAQTGAGCSQAVMSSGTALTITAPSSIATGNLMLAQVTVRSNATITAPGGWTKIGSTITSGVGLEQAIYYRIATGSDVAGSTTYAWSWTGSADATGGILGYKNIDAGSPVDTGISTSATLRGLPVCAASSA